jgi:outer membrane protein OmpA-like peptidoglycan-associated protein
MKWGALLVIDYANDPLVYELADSDDEISVVQDQLVLHAGFALGIVDSITVFAMLPIDVVMSGEDPGMFAPPADGAGIGDLAFGGRIVMVGAERSTFALSGELIARLPTASLVDSSQVYAGDEIGSYEPALVAELRFGRFDFRIRPGIRLREERQVGNLTLGTELVYGAGARLRIAKGLHAHAEVFGATAVESFGEREQTPLELLLGGKYGSDDWIFGVAAGPGLAEGYGAPDLRVVGTLGYAPVSKPAVEEPKDSDGDGLFDADDVCPRRAEDRDEFEDLDGCPDPDNDKDGIWDRKDECVMEPEDTDGFEDEDGCPDADNDRDGVLDADDECGNDPEDKDEFEDEDGCPDADNDKDRVLDADDECPVTPGHVEAKGCPKSVRLDIASGRINILDRVEFATNKDVILADSESILQEVEQTLNVNPHLKLVRIEGHTDDVGADKKNMDLSQRRARSVVRWLAQNGVDVERMEAYGCGENRPLAEGKSKAARKQNRRVEFHIVEPSPPDPRSTQGCKSIDTE